MSQANPGAIPRRHPRHANQTRPSKRLCVAMALDGFRVVEALRARKSLVGTVLASLARAFRQPADRRRGRRRQPDATRPASSAAPKPTPATILSTVRTHTRPHAVALVGAAGTAGPAVRATSGRAGWGRGDGRGPPAARPSGDGHRGNGGPAAMAGSDGRGLPTGAARPAGRRRQVRATPTTRRRAQRSGRPPGTYSGRKVNHLPGVARAIRFRVDPSHAMQEIDLHNG
jgi:hypothetical protein